MIGRREFITLLGGKGVPQVRFAPKPVQSQTAVARKGREHASLFPPCSGLQNGQPRLKSDVPHLGWATASEPASFPA
jgi:hypothetical protein